MDRGAFFVSEAGTSTSDTGADEGHSPIGPDDRATSGHLGPDRANVSGQTNPEHPKDDSDRSTSAPAPSDPWEDRRTALRTVIAQARGWQSALEHGDVATAAEIACRGHKSSACLSTPEAAHPVLSDTRGH